MLDLLRRRWIHLMNKWKRFKHMLMSEIEVIIDDGRRRRWPTAEKLRIVEKTVFDGGGEYSC
jgi:transposase-like protein